MRKELIEDIKKIDRKTLNKMLKTRWYHRLMIDLYLTEGSLRAASKATGIHYVSIYHTIKEAIKWANGKNKQI